MDIGDRRRVRRLRRSKEHGTSIDAASEPAHFDARWRPRQTSAVVLEAKRLRLRPLAMPDIDEFVALHDDPEVTRFIGGSDDPRPRSGCGGAMPSMVQIRLPCEERPTRVGRRGCGPGGRGFKSRRSPLVKPA